MDEPKIHVRPVEIGPLPLAGILATPASPKGVVAFAHGSGSGRLSPRNGRVAAALDRAGFATLLLDLLTEAEERDRANVFDIALLAERLRLARAFLAGCDETARLPVGYFGASTGAAAALVAAADPDSDVAAVVSRGGRPDLAGDALDRVRAPTLLIVGGNDGPVIDLNRGAFLRLGCRKEMVIVPRAGHLFEEPGAMDQVIDHAARWFGEHLGGAAEAGR